MGNEKLKFSSYPGMGRTASYFGIPQFILLGLILTGVLFVFIFVAIFGWWGSASAIVPMTALIVVRAVCETDSRFLTRYKFMLKRYRMNMIYGRCLMITPANPRWEHFYGKQISQKRFSTRNINSSDEVSR